MKLSVVLAAAGIGCPGSSSTSSSGASGPPSSADSTTAAAGASSSTGSASTGTGTTGGSSSGQKTSGTSAGSSTGTTGRGPPPVYIDGGYVYCQATVATDAGQEDLAWECRPGTYFCATDGTKTCAECVTDSDCTNYDLPTFDPARRYCDVSSGVAGYQGFCQECLTNANCNGKRAGPFCDLDPVDWGPPTETIGFEACEPKPLGCAPGTVPAIGGCASDHCTSDADCANALNSLLQLTPYCVAGSCAITAGGSACPDCECFSNDVCGSPGPGPLSCGPDFRCQCTDSSQCGSAWPICLLPPGGQDGGTCGCAKDFECGDAGLRCLTYPPSGFNFGGSACTLPCNDPRAPICSLWSIKTPICDPFGGQCQPCGGDNDCQTKAMGPSDGPFCRLDGLCGCAKSADCPQGQTCQAIDVQSSAGGLLGYCAPPPPACTVGSCRNGRCDLDSGACVTNCLSDEDCWNNQNGELCEPDGGVCAQCRDDSDCVKSGGAAIGESYCDQLRCIFGCASDIDCVGNGYGSHCVAPGISSRCGCGSDLDCAGNPNGPYCDTNPNDGEYGDCTCLDTAECPAAEVCSQASPGSPGTCTTSCYYSDAGCQAGFFCDWTYACRPRCDPGHGCQAPDSVCDVDNFGGENVGQNQDGGVGDGGDGGSESSPEVIWCYQCLSASDCPAGQACDRYSHTCGTCYESQACRTDEVCLSDAACHALCDAGACPAGEVCDVNDAALGGADVCYQCLSPSDCPDGEGCNGRNHTCGTCIGPSAVGLEGDCAAPYYFCNDCPPDNVCSNYWVQNPFSRPGVCLQNCDFTACPEGQTCNILPDLTPDHAYCFSCLSDADCSAGGSGAWCDDSVNFTFTCQPPPK